MKFVHSRTARAAEVVGCYPVKQHLGWSSWEFLRERLKAPLEISTKNPIFRVQKSKQRGITFKIGN